MHFLRPAACRSAPPRCIIRPCQEMNKGAKWAPLPNLRGLSVFSPHCSWRCRPVLRLRPRRPWGSRSTLARDAATVASTSALPPPARTGRMAGDQHRRGHAGPGGRANRVHLGHVQRVLSAGVLASQPAGTQVGSYAYVGDTRPTPPIRPSSSFSTSARRGKSCCRVLVPTELAPRRRNRRWSHWRPGAGARPRRPGAHGACSSPRPAERPSRRA
jgi:hypothetical protein